MVIASMNNSYRLGWISAAELPKSADAGGKSSYRNHPRNAAEGKYIERGAT